MYPKVILNPSIHVAYIYMRNLSNIGHTNIDGKSFVGMFCLANPVNGRLTGTRHYRLTSTLYRSVPIVGVLEESSCNYMSSTIPPFPPFILNSSFYHYLIVYRLYYHSRSFTDFITGRVPIGAAP